MFRSTSALALAAVLALAGCATSSPDVISRHDTQRMSTVLDATVLAVRPVTVDGSQNGAGGVAGAVIAAAVWWAGDGLRDLPSPASLPAMLGLAATLWLLVVQALRELR